MHFSRQSSGFTLLELVVAVAILAILLTIGIPSFSTFIDSSQRRAVSEALASSVKVARSEAITRGVNTTLCRRNDAGTACDNGDDWGAGWIVVPSGADPVRVWDAVPDSFSLSVSGASQSLTFTPEGSVSDEASFQFSLDAAGETYTYTVTATGSFEEN